MGAIGYVAVICLTGLLFEGVSAAPNASYIAPMPTARTEFGAVAATNGKLYAIGGSNAAGVLATVEEYDPLSNVWTRRTDAPTFQQGRGVVASATGKVYAIGGNSAPTSVEEYDPASDTWRTRAPLVIGMVALSAAELTGKIYAVGSQGVQEYDPTNDTWRARAPLLTPRENLAVVALDGKIYAIGGSSNVPACPDSFCDLVEMYDPVSNVWVSKAGMPTRRYGLSAVASGGRIYAIGGRDPNVLSNAVGLTAVEEYDPLSNSWSRKSSMPTGRWGLAAAVQGGVVYAMGGKTDSSSNSLLASVDGYRPATDSWNTSIPTLVPTPTITPTLTPSPVACLPRPPVTVSVSRPAFRQLNVTVLANTSPATPLNWLRRIRFQRLDNAAVNTRDALNQRQPFVLELPERPRQAAFTVTWSVQGPVMVTLVVEDDCGEWRTFVGGGTGAF